MTRCDYCQAMVAAPCASAREASKCFRVSRTNREKMCTLASLIESGEFVEHPGGKIEGVFSTEAVAAQETADRYTHSED